MQDFVHQQSDKVGVPKDVGLGGLGVQKRLRSNAFPSPQSRQTQHNPPNEDQHIKTLPRVSIVVPFFGLTNFICRVL